MNEEEFMTHEASSNMHHDSSQFSTVINSAKSRHLTHKSAMVRAGIGRGDRFIETEVLLDSGADFNAMSAHFYRKLKSRDFNLKLIPSSQSSPPTAANSQPVKVVGDCILDVMLTSVKKKKNIVRSVRFVVIVNLNAPCIIGIGTLRMLGFFVKGTRMEVAGHRICSVSNRKTIQFVDLVEINGTRWGLYSSSKFSEDSSSQLSATDSKNRMNQLYSTLAETNSSVYTPNKMHVGEYLVKLETADDPPSELILKEDHFRLLNNEPKNSNNHAERTLITDSVITEMVKKSNFSLNGKKKLKKLLEKFRSVFSSSSFDVGSYNGGTAKLNFKGDEKPVFVPVRRIPHSLRDWLSKHLDEMVEKQIITKCKGSRWNSPLFVVPKKVDGWRPVSDFRLLNKQLEDVYFPIPFIADLLDNLHGKKFFSSVDLRSGFYNVKLDETSTDCTAFSALGQTYKYLRLPQGIKSSPIIFQQIMVEILEDLENCLVYMDDVLLTSISESSALLDIARLLERFQRHGFLLNPSKCLFGVTKLIYLGYHISEVGWTISRSKVQDLINVKPPTTTSEVRSFTGMCNFYVNCCANLQRLMRPLHALTGKKKFKWTDECQMAFDMAKSQLANATTLAYPSMNKDDTFYLTTDASDSGWGGCLSQFQKDKGFEVPLSFSSGSFTNAEVNWPIKEKELYSFVRNLRNYETYLFGKKFVWRTDNRALSYFLSENVIKCNAQKSCSPKVARWLDYLNEYDYSIEHHNGTTDVMGGPDFLSRKRTAVLGALTGKLDLNNIWLFSGITIAEMVQAQQDDVKMQQFQNGYAALKSKKLWEILDRNGMMVAKKVKENKEVVVVPSQMVNDVLEFHHGPQHAGIVSMTRAISSKFFIPNMTKNIREFTKQCENCIKAKVQKKRPEEPVLQSSSKHPWMMVSADLIGPFPISYNQNQYCLVIVDNLTRWTEIRPIKSKSAKDVADAFMNVFHIRGLPLSILTDNGKEFYNFGLQKMFEKLGTNLQYTTPYRPQSNGITERCNLKIKQLLKLWNVNDATWDMHIGPIQFLINNEFNRMLNMSAFQAIHGWTLSRMDFLKPEKIENLSITDFDSKLWAKQHSQRMAKSLGQLFLNDVKNKKTRYEKLRKSYKELNPDTENEFPVGAHVLVQFPQAPGTSKLMSSWRGKFIVINKVDKNVYLVAHEEGHRRKMLIHQSRLKRLPIGQGRDLTSSDSHGAVTRNCEHENENNQNAKDVRGSEKLRISNEQSTGKDKCAGYGDKKHPDLETNEKDGERKANVRNTKQKKIQKWEVPETKSHGMKLRTRK